MLTGRYFYKGQDVSMCVLMQIEHATRMLAERIGIGFDEMLGRFYRSRTFRNLIDTSNGLWAESAAYIADDYQRVS